MSLTATIKRAENTETGKVCYALVQLAASYSTGGDVLDLTASPFTGANAFTTVRSVKVVEGPQGSDYAVTDPATVCKVQYVAAASRAVATGTLMAFAENGSSGVTAEVTASTDISAVYVLVKIDGT